MAICTLSFNFPDSIPGGTGPYKTSLDVSLEEEDDMPSCLAAGVAWWIAATTFRGYFASIMGNCTVSLEGVWGGLVSELATDSATTATGTVPDMPGASMRAIKLGPRPEGGRRGSMYWPGISGAVTAGTGIVDLTPRANMKTALDDLISDLNASNAGAQVVQRHTVAGEETTSPVEEFSIASTITWMQRRYR